MSSSNSVIGPTPPEGDFRSNLAARTFPTEWAKWSTLTGPSARKRRHQLRQAAEHQVAMGILHAAGESCGTCGAFNRKGPCGSYCDLDSGGGAYTLTQASNLCVRWIGPAASRVAPADEGNAVT